MDDTPTQTDSHGVSVSVIGLGTRGSQIVHALDTQAPIRTITISREDDATGVLDTLADDGICFVTGALDEAGVTDQFASILPPASPYTVVLPEGSATGVQLIAEHADWLLPIKLADDCRSVLSQTITDLCESILPPTGRDLGIADLVIAGSDRIGSVSMIPPAEALDRQTVESLPDTELTDPDSFLYFFCTPTTPNRQAIESRISSLDRPVARAFLWDYRIHPRYAEMAHVKRIISASVSTESRIRILQR